MFCVLKCVFELHPKHNIRSRKSMLVISAPDFLLDLQPLSRAANPGELHYQHRLRMDVGLWWLWAVGEVPCLGSEIYFLTPGNMLMLLSKMEWYRSCGSCGLNPICWFLGVTCFFSPLFNGCWRLSVWLVTHMLRGAEFASADTFPGVIKNGFNGFMICL